MKNTRLKGQLKNNERTLGSWVTIGHPAVVEILSNADFDWLTIDVEHNSIDPAMLTTLIATIQSKNIAALVRVSKNEEVPIKHAMDAGADGVIVPMVNSREDAVKAVEYVKYPPRGKRGVGLSRAQNYGMGFESYKQWLQVYSVIIAQIEHNEGIRNIEQIIEVPDIDGILIGPYDLSGSLGYPGDFSREEVREALIRVEQVCRERNFPMGFHVVQPDVEEVARRREAGYSFIAFSTDFLLMGDTAKKLVNHLRK
jgi:2-dehydro-3-deoxyglucarate aldolase